ncbi:MAG TPA: hypothetical protein VFQ18_03965 [Candidatus Acidoferrum sp.]|nr:hypothetical protein [Candidatus Acidoferrum sp.]
MNKRLKQIFGMLIAAAPLLFCAASAQAQSPTPAPERGQISESLRTVAYPEVIYDHSIVPDWDRGYVIHHEIEVNYSPDAAMVVMYNAAGKRVREGRIWPQGAGSVSIRRTAATRDGAILAAGWAIMQDGSTPGYIAKTDLAGNTIQSVETGAFKSEQLCEAPDGTVWSLGKAVRPDGLPVPDTEVVRHYSFEKGLLQSFLPENTVQAIMDSERPWFVSFGSFLRCGKEKVSIYFKFTDEYAEINISSFELKRWKLDEGAVRQGKASGLAITEDGRVYASFSAHGMSGPSGLTGLYQVKTESGNPVARLLPVIGTISDFESGKPRVAGAFLRLWGADGNQLVVRRAEERDASWVSVLNSPASN